MLKKWTYVPSHIHTNARDILTSCRRSREIKNKEIIYFRLEIAFIYITDFAEILKTFKKKS